MDTKKIGGFLRELRKERGLTQEQLAEILLVSGRTVSRWETGANMPDLSILIQIAEFYDVEIKEILDGERKSETMDQELKETLSKVADYNKLEKERAEKAGNIAFGLTFLVCAAAIIIQLIVTGNLPVILGETVTLVAGGVAYIGIMLYSGVWESGSCFKSDPVKDLLISVVCSGIFTAGLILCYLRLGAGTSQIVHLAVIFFTGIAVIGFALLRSLAYCNHKRRLKNETARENREEKEVHLMSIFTADGNVQADRIVEALKENGIIACKQDLGDAGFASVRYGMGRGLDDRVAIYVAEEKADEAMRVLKEMETE